MSPKPGNFLSRFAICDFKSAFTAVDDGLSADLPDAGLASVLSSRGGAATVAVVLVADTMVFESDDGFVTIGPDLRH